MPVVNELPTQGAQFGFATGNTPNSSGSATLSYPTGFTKDNCFIVNMMIYYNNSWITYAYGQLNADNESPNPSRFFASLNDDGVSVYVGMKSGNWYYNKPLKVLLYKYQ